MSKALLHDTTLHRLLLHYEPPRNAVGLLEVHSSTRLSGKGPKKQPHLGVIHKQRVQNICGLAPSGFLCHSSPMGNPFPCTFRLLPAPLQPHMKLNPICAFVQRQREAWLKWGVSQERRSWSQESGKVTI